MYAHGCGEVCNTGLTDTDCRASPSDWIIFHDTDVVAVCTMKPAFFKFWKRYDTWQMALEIKLNGGFTDVHGMRSHTHMLTLTSGRIQQTCLNHTQQWRG